MFRYRTLYLPDFLFYIEWKSVRLELLTSIQIPDDLNYYKVVCTFKNK